MCLGLYWPVLSGKPIWDDQTFLFQSAVMKPNFSNWEILKSFNWPVSVMAQKGIFAIFGDHYPYYHLVNITIHIINSLLLYLCAKRLNLTYALLLYALFILHPSNVITVSWIIQFKTLICFTFAILSFYFLLRSEESHQFKFFSLIFFLLSILSKSASIPFAAILAAHYFVTKKKSFKILFIPLLLLTAIASFRILKSPSSPISSPYVSMEKVEKVHNQGTLSLSHQISNILGTSYYYFWQVFLPIQNAPVKGLRYDQFSIIQFAHIFFISLLLFMLGNSFSSYVLLSGHLMLLPFMGIVFAPFMNITWVSDQHLYLALPLFLCFALELIKKGKWRFLNVIPYFFLLLFVFKIYETVPYYKDEMTFFEASLKADPYNVPIAHNLVISYLEHNQLNQALNLSETFIHMAEGVPEIRSNPYFPDLFLLNLRLHQPSQESK